MAEEPESLELTASRGQVEVEVPAEEKGEKTYLLSPKKKEQVRYENHRH